MTSRDSRLVRHPWAPYQQGSLADPSKSRWHEREEALLAVIQAELARNSDEGPPPPPPSDDGAAF